MNLHLSDTLIGGEVILISMRRGGEDFLTLASMRGGGEELGRQLTE